MPENDPNVLLEIAGIAIGIAGIIIGIIVSAFFYLRSKTKYLLEYEVHSAQLITEKMTSIPNLKVTINDQPVESLTSTTIKFSNAGNQSIVLSDFADREPLGITITGHLHSYDVSADNPNSIPELQPIDDKTFRVKFDFLKQKQSFSITLLHDGDINVFGELKTGKIRGYQSRLTLRSSLASGILAGFFFALTCSFFVLTAYINNPIIETVLPGIKSSMAVLIPTVLVYMVWHIFEKKD